MKEQAQLREEMAYQYKLGNFEVRRPSKCRIWSISTLLLTRDLSDFVGSSCYPEKVGSRCSYVRINLGERPSRIIYASGISLTKHLARPT